MQNPDLPFSLDRSLYDQLDEKILPLVMALHEIGVITVSSCEGHVGEKHNSSHAPFCVIDIGRTPAESLNFLECIVKGYNIFHADEAPWKIIAVNGYFYGDETDRVWKLMPDEENHWLLEELQESIEELVRFIGQAQVVSFL